MQREAVKEELLSLHRKEEALIKNNSMYSLRDLSRFCHADKLEDELSLIAQQLVKSRTDKAKISQVLEVLALSVVPEYPRQSIFDKIQAAVQTMNKRAINMTEQVERFVSVTDGDFSVTSCYEVLQSITGVTIRDKSTIRQILKRLKDDGKIQKVGTKDGVYRRVDDVAEEIEWWNADDKPAAFKLPLGILEYCTIYPKNIITIAGSPNSGKTALSLNIALLNAGNSQVDYYSSEMGDCELKTRLSLFQGVSFDTWKRIKFKERAGNFADVIHPDHISIIDFLELTNDFWQIASLTKEIYDRLNTGICVINIQKGHGKEIGRGGDLGLEKPRLYLALESGRVKIIKAKAWAKTGLNPNGLQREFKIVQGAKFITEPPLKPWHKEGEL